MRLLLDATFVSMGNPHAVICTDDVAVDLSPLGPLIENHKAFPAGSTPIGCRWSRPAK
jgi:diaminopimelate epimerase